MIKNSNIIEKIYDQEAKYYSRALYKNIGREYLSSLETNFLKRCFKQKGKKCLDLGIGIGRNAKIILEKQNSLIGVDNSKEMLKESEKNLSLYYKNGKLKLLKVDLNKRLPFQNNSFDSVICFRVIKYLVNWKKLIYESNRVLKPNGVFIIEIPNSYSVQAISEKYNVYRTFKDKDFSNELVMKGFKIQKKYYGSKLPFFIYDHVRFKKSMDLLVGIESILNRLFKNKLSKNIIYICIKDDK